MAQLNVRRPRPRKLSDPHYDFRRKGIAELLAVPDAKLQWSHYKSLLGPYSPAGTYEEVIYFLPLAFDHLIAHDQNAIDLVTTPIWFASEYDEQLRHDGLRNAVRDRIRDCFSHWTREFEVIHFDLDACRHKGWGLHYNDVVKYSQEICEGIEDLVRFKNHADLALEFYQLLSQHGDDDVKAAWFLALPRSQDAVYPPPNDPPIRELLNDRSLLESAAEVVRKRRIQSETSPTYWNDTFVALGLYE